MKYNKIFFRTLFCLSATVALASCDNDDLIVGGADTGVIGAPDGNVVYVTDAIGQSDGSMFTFPVQAHSTSMHAHLRRYRVIARSHSTMTQMC